MRRYPRYLPHPGALVEVTQRTIQGRHLLKPSPALNQLLIGTLAKAQRESCIQIQAVAVMSNHFHLLITPESVEQMAQFMAHFQTNLSKEVGRLYDWPGSIFDQRYRSIPVSDEPEAQISRLAYLLAQGCKEGLVASPLEWPGVHCGPSLTTGKALEGVWIDRRSLHAARARNEGAKEKDFAEILEVDLTPLPCWNQLSQNSYRSRIEELIQKIESDTRAMHRRARSRPVGKVRILRGSPHRRSPLEARPCPKVHAYRRRIRIALRDAFREFVVSYRLAASRLRAGQWPVLFPAGCFPPRLPFIPPIELLDPG